ncbi:hypothetical protein EBT31_07460, partial [bacterium]|nr:hypothetical protein [bacterium]
MGEEYARDVTVTVTLIREDVDRPGDPLTWLAMWSPSGTVESGKVQFFGDCGNRDLQIALEWIDALTVVVKKAVESGIRLDVIHAVDMPNDTRKRLLKGRWPQRWVAFADVLGQFVEEDGIRIHQETPTPAQRESYLARV